MTDPTDETTTGSMTTPPAHTPSKGPSPMSFTRSKRARVALVSALAAVLALALLVPATASSHREAPLITEDPVADNTDTYAFMAPGGDNVVLMANWIPLEEPAGGPNFYNFGEDVLYKINVDNDGDAVADVVYEWRFTSTFTKPMESFLYADGPITSLDDENFLYRQTYTLSVVKDGQRTVLGQDLPVPPNNIGPRSTPDYDALAQQAVVDVGSIRSFAGQRDEAFQVDLGSIFDLAGLRPLNDLHAVPPNEPAAGKDSTAGYNVHSVVLEIPKADLLLNNDQPVIGVWSSTDRRHTKVFAGGNSADPVSSGPFTQVSRLGMPLVNEVVLPIGIKDTFNTLAPADDAGALSNEDGTVNFVQVNVELPKKIEALYGVPAPAEPRDDLVSVFLTGLEGVNQIPDGVPAEMIRLNTSVPPTPLAEQSRLGALGGPGADGEMGTADDVAPQPDGFPNGRRLIDDTVDIELRVVAGALTNPDTPPLTDGVDYNDKQLLEDFPYIPGPFQGYENAHQDAATTTPSNG